MIYNIASYHNGLGDCLQHSTLPERLSNYGHKVRLYTGSDVMPFRNPEIRKLVWDMNPFVKGESKTGWNLGDVPERPYVNNHNDFIKNWESIFGLKPENSLPKIYYKPKRRNIEGVIELSAISLKYESEKVIKSVERLLEKKSYVQIVSDHQDCVIPINVPQLKVKSLFEVCDLIYSCSHLITLNSGVHSLAAAIRRMSDFKQDCLLPEKDYGWIMESKKFIYPEIKYHI